MGQANVLVDVVGTIVDGEYGGLGGVENFDHAFAELDRTGRQLVVEGAGGPLAHHAGDTHYVFVANLD